MVFSRRVALMGLLLPSLLVTIACEEPPNREMNQAQGVIDAARAAGADQYAPEEYAAAVESLAKSREAADQRDYRLALNFALDAHERGQIAARSAADHKARVRSETDRMLDAADSAAELAASRLAAAEGARVPSADRTRYAARLDVERTTIDRAREEIDADDLHAARAHLEPVVERLAQLISEIDAAVVERSARRPGRR